VAASPKDRNKFLKGRDERKGADEVKEAKRVEDGNTNAPNVTVQ
jgi:hypothetical protein